MPPSKSSPQINCLQFAVLQLKLTILVSSLAFEGVFPASQGPLAMEGGRTVRKNWFVAVMAVLLLSGFGFATMACDIGNSDDCHAQCDTDEDCGEGYLCYDDGLCDNEDKNCVEDE